MFAGGFRLRKRRDLSNGSEDVFSGWKQSIRSNVGSDCQKGCLIKYHMLSLTQHVSCVRWLPGSCVILQPQTSFGTLGTSWYNINVSKQSIWHTTNIYKNGLEQEHTNTNTIIHISNHANLWSIWILCSKKKLCISITSIRYEIAWLVGWTNPFEKYSSNWKSSSPIFGVKI